MPYITPNRREFLHWKVTDYPDNAGELNYVLTRAINGYFEDHPNYQGINDILGALEGAKQEFYARVARPYEDNKIKENGDVY